MEQIITRFFDMINVGYFVSVILLSYLLIKVVDFFNKEKNIPTWVKRVITFMVGIALFFVFKYFGKTTFEELFTSYLLALFVYDAAIKLLIEKLHIEYKK